MELPKGNKVQEFFDFIQERHAIWVRRFVAKQPFPWTEDPILQKYKFCNVYRKLDRGTEFYLDKMKGVRSWESILLNTIIYRLINTIDILNECEWPIDYHADSVIAVSNFANKYKRSVSKLNPAYKIYGTYGKYPTAKDMILHVLWDTYEKLPALYKKLTLEDCGLEAAWKSLQVIDEVGPFLAYEIVCDLMYLNFLPYSENDFVNVGPGAEWGLKIMFEGKDKYRGLSSAELVKHLQKVQYQYLEKNFVGEELTLRDIEHSLCEFRKYHNFKAGTGRGRLFKLKVPKLF